MCVWCVLKSHMSCLDFLHSKHLTSNGNWAALSHFSRRRWPLLLLLLLLLLLSSVTCLNSCPPCDSCCVLQSQTPCLDICSTYIMLLPDHPVYTSSPIIILLSSLAFVISTPNYLCQPAVNRSLHNLLLLFSSMWAHLSFPVNLNLGGAFVCFLQNLLQNFCLFHSSNVSCVFLFPDVQCLDDGVRV